MYQYQIVLDKMDQVNEGHRLTIEEAQQKVGEKKHRIKLQDAFDNFVKEGGMSGSYLYKTQK